MSTLKQTDIDAIAKMPDTAKIDEIMYKFDLVWIRYVLSIPKMAPLISEMYTNKVAYIS